MNSFIPAKNRNLIYSLEKGLSILALFSQLGPELNLTEIAKAAQMGLGNASRYIQTLMQLGYISRDLLTKRYHLAPKILSLGFSLLKEMDLRKRVTPYLSEITREFGVGSQCAILDETEIIYIERFRARTLVTLDLTIGSRLPAFCTALGRAILAFLDKDTAQNIMEKTHITQLTPYTISSKTKLLRELDLTRKRGYAINMQELVLGQSAVAAPVFNNGFVEGSLGFSFPSKAIGEKKFKVTIIKRMIEIAEKASISQSHYNSGLEKIRVL